MASIYFHEMLNDILYMQGSFIIVPIRVEDYRLNLQPDVIDILLSGQQTPITIGDDEVGRIIKCRIVNNIDMHVFIAVLNYQTDKFNAWVDSLGGEVMDNMKLLDEGL